MGRTWSNPTPCLLLAPSHYFKDILIVLLPGFLFIVVLEESLGSWAGSNDKFASVPALPLLPHQRLYFYFIFLGFLTSLLSALSSSLVLSTFALVDLLLISLENVL